MLVVCLQPSQLWLLSSNYRFSSPPLSMLQARSHQWRRLISSFKTHHAFNLGQCRTLRLQQNFCRLEIKTRCSSSQEFNSDEQGLRRQSKPFWFHGKFGILSLGVIVVKAVASFLRYLEQKLKRKTGHEALLMQGGLGMALLSTSTMAKDHISPVIVTLRANPTFMAGLLAWAIAQTTKVFTTYFVEGRWDFEKLLGSGGMPSSHSALCVGLTTSVAFCHGLSDCLFPVCLGFSLIVMYDAIGVRRHAGMQAEVLNVIIKDLFQGHPISEKKLKELLGHTPLQVFAGACLGILVGYWCSHPCQINMLG